MPRNWFDWWQGLRDPQPTPEDDRRAAAMVGLMVGDALGASWEFMDADEILVEEFTMQGGGPFGFAPGETTDDTAMAIGALGGYDGEGAFDAGVALQNYLLWLESRPKDVGNQTRVALGHWRRDPTGRALAPDEAAQGNGTAMRAAAHGIASPTAVDAVNNAVADAFLTHPSNVAAATSAYVASSVFDLITGLPALEAHANALGRAHAISDVHPLDTYRSPKREAGGWCVHSVRLAAWGLVKTESYEQGINVAIRTGGDTDTNAAIMGAILGARDGCSAIPERWVEKLLIPAVVAGADGRLIWAR